MTHFLWQHIRTVPDFPIEGVDFYDISPLFAGHIDELVDAIIQSIPKQVLEQAEALVAIESRGFILASLLATRTKKNLILVRKAGKLPPPVYQAHYGLEYGSDTLEIAQTGQASRVILIDDVLATGGTLIATQELCQKAGHTVLGASILLDLTDLHGQMPFDFWSVLEK